MKVNPLILSILKDKFIVCRIDSFKQIPDRILQSHFYSITKTADEISVICPEEFSPDDSPCEKNWRCFKIHGPLDFAQTGILASMTTPLADAGISIFAFSTYDTDYFMVKDVDVELAIAALTQNGHEIHNLN
jgi:uncharacterized protein